MNTPQEAIESLLSRDGRRFLTLPFPDPEPPTPLVKKACSYSLGLDELPHLVEEVVGTLEPDARLRQCLYARHSQQYPTLFWQVVQFLSSKGEGQFQDLWHRATIGEIPEPDEKLSAMVGGKLDLSDFDLNSPEELKLYFLRLVEIGFISDSPGNRVHAVALALMCTKGKANGWKPSVPSAFLFSQLKSWPEESDLSMKHKREAIRIVEGWG